VLYLVLRPTSNTDLFLFCQVARLRPVGQPAPAASPFTPIGRPWASRQQVGHLAASRTACRISIPLAAQTAAKQLSQNLAAATCHILKRTQVNPLCLSRNNPIACTPADRPITRRGSKQASTHVGSKPWPVCTAAGGLTHSATRAGRDAGHHGTNLGHPG